MYYCITNSTRLKHTERRLARFITRREEKWGKKWKKETRHEEEPINNERGLYMQMRNANASVMLSTLLQQCNQRNEKNDKRQRNRSRRTALNSSIYAFRLVIRSRDTDAAFAQPCNQCIQILITAIHVSISFTKQEPKSRLTRSPTGRFDPRYTTIPHPSPHSPTNHTAKAQYVLGPTPTSVSHPPCQA